MLLNIRVIYIRHLFSQFSGHRPIKVKGVLNVMVLQIMYKSYG